MFKAKLNNVINYLSIDKVTLVFYVTLFWVKIGLYYTKFIELILRMLLKFPDKWLYSLAQSFTVQTAKKEDIQILFASTDKEEITNKLKILMYKYWEKASITDANGFDFGQIQKLIGCSVLYCCYRYREKNVTIESLISSMIGEFLITHNPTDNTYLRVNGTMQNEESTKEIPFRYVEFK